MTTDKLLNTPVELIIGELRFTVAALSMRGERALVRELSGMLAADADPIKRVQPILDRLEAEKRTGDRREVLLAAVNSAIEGELPGFGVVMSAREHSPAVLAREVYRRAKPFNPKLELREVEAVITEANVSDVWFDLEVALGRVEGDSDPKAM